MSSHAAHAAQTTQAAAQLFTGATFGGGIMTWMTTNSGALTAITVMVTGVGSLYYGYENKKSTRMSALAEENRNRIEESRNRINERDITLNIIDKLKRSGKDTKYIDDFVESMRK